MTRLVGTSKAIVVGLGPTGRCGGGTGDGCGTVDYFLLSEGRAGSVSVTLTWTMINPHLPTAALTIGLASPPGPHLGPYSAWFSGPTVPAAYDGNTSVTNASTAGDGTGLDQFTGGLGNVTLQDGGFYTCFGMVSSFGGNPGYTDGMTYIGPITPWPAGVSVTLIPTGFIGPMGYDTPYVIGSFTAHVQGFGTSTGSGDGTISAQSWTGAAGTGPSSRTITSTGGHVSVTSVVSGSNFASETLPFAAGTSNTFLLEFRLDARPTGVPDVYVQLAVGPGNQAVGVRRSDGSAGGSPGNGDFLYLDNGSGTLVYGQFVMDPTVYYMVRWVFSSVALVAQTARIWATGATGEPTTWLVTDFPTASAAGTSITWKETIPGATQVQTVTSDIIVIEANCK